MSDLHLKYQFFFDENPLPSIIFDRETLVIVDVNKRAVEHYGYTREEFLSMTVKDLRPPEEIPALMKSLATSASEVSKTRFYRHKKKDGTLMDVMAFARDFDIGGRSCRFVAFTDITEKKKIEEALIKSEKQFRAIYDQASHLVGIVSREGVLLETNRIAREFIGKDKSSFIGKLFWETPWWEHSPEAQNLLKSGFERALQGEFVRFETTHVNHENELRYIDFSIKPVLDKDGKVFCLIPEGLDITDRKQAEKEREKLQAQLGQAQKMESIGRLAGGVAHDFNNMLGAIIGYVELGLIRSENDPEMHSYLKQIQAAALRSADLTKQLLAFARKQTIAPRILELNKTIAGMLKMIQRLIGEDIELEWRPAEDLWHVNLDPSQVDQLLMNLCVNARDAIDGPGRISIRTGNEILTEADHKKMPESRSGHFVMIEVSDNGHGMDEKVLSHLYEPFFTTKEPGKGTGLGLSTVYGIVQQNDGFINVESRPSLGTIFRIYLPRHQPSPGDKENAGVKKPAERGRETILLVEDEPMLLDMTKEMLELHGYHVLTAQNPDEACRLAEEHADEIHLLMTDVIMPGMNGRVLAEKLTDRIPGLKSLFMSGYTASIIARQGVLDEGVYFIQKPFSIHDLTVKVRQVLNEEG